ncbi:MAG: 2-oxoacid:acceptor oxidoreductase subunit alpha [bacterium]
MDLLIRIAGEAGQGVQTTGSLLAGALAKLGVHVLSTQSYMSRIRGGLNWMDLRIGDAELSGGRDKADLLISFTTVGRDVLQGEMVPDGIILLDAERDDKSLAVPFTKIAKESGGSTLMANTVATGVIFAILGYDIKALLAFINEEFAHKGGEISHANIAAAQAGSAHAEALKIKLFAPRHTSAPVTITSGATAIALGAATAGVKLVASYPMSPSTATLAALAAMADEYNIVVEQAEDEIAAINMVCGATYAGVPALTTTSGGGFALMAEGLSLAGMLELPAFIVLAQRPGPATGMPTRTAQSDLQFALHAGHGEFPRAIFAPGTVEQCFELTRHALEVAHQYQTPVILLTDQYLQDMEQNIPRLDVDAPHIDRHIVPNVHADYQRYAVTDNGISPRAIPGGISRIVMDSDEHDSAGHLSEDFAIHLEQYDKRLRKEKPMANSMLTPVYYGPPDAENLLITWGSTYGAALETVERLNDSAHSYGMLHFTQLWPLNIPVIENMLVGYKHYITVEGNATGQFAALLREQGLIKKCAYIHRYDGLAFTADYLVAAILGGK